MSVYMEIPAPAFWLCAVALLVTDVSIVVATGDR